MTQPPLLLVLTVTLVLLLSKVVYKLVDTFIAVGANEQQLH